jgi:hypothetical protein
VADSPGCELWAHTRNRNLMHKKSLVPAVALALIAFPEPVTTAVGLAMLCLYVALPALTRQTAYRPAPCSGTVVLRGSLPDRFLDYSGPRQNRY